MPALPDPAAGALSFQVLAEISAGATARIDLCRVTDARRPDLQGQLLAVKRLHPHIAEDPGFQNQFQDEVWMTSALTHPNVVVVKGWGTDSIGSYLAVELVQGVSLARLMKTVFDTGEVFTERMVVYVAARLCRGLAAAHALRAPNGELLHLVHRDLTPGNVLVSFTGDVKIADFGLAKAKQRLTKTLTGMSKGEPTYMAPEQARADEIDARADLFSLGVMLFELFAGRRPWLAKSDFDMVQVTSRDPPADLRELRPKIDRELIAVVLKCLEKDPGTRFQSAGEIAERLETWLKVHGYMEDNEEALGRFVRRNAMRQMRWFERAIAGELALKPKIGRQLPPRTPPPESPDRGAERPRIPGVPVPKAKARTRTTTLDDSDDDDDDDDDETDVTDTEWRIARQTQLGGAPRIVAKDDADGEGEEIPTLVQSGSASLDALREGARASAKRAGGGRSLIEPPQITDEDSAERITSIKRTQDGMPLPTSLGEDASSEELPTAPVRARHGAPAHRLPPPPQHPAPRHEATRSGMIPASPNIPPAYGAPAPYAPTGFGPPSSPSYASPKTEPPPSRAATTARLTVGDDVQVIDRSAMSGAALTEESLIAEADRLAIEAVRRSEEARSAALRAERRAAMAKLSADAAAIAADAVRILGTSGLAAAGQRLEQARSVERSISRAQADPGGATMRIPDASSGSHSSPPSSGGPAASTSRPSFRPPSFDGAAAGPSQSPSFPQLPPPSAAPLAFPGSTLRPDPPPQRGAFDDRVVLAKLKSSVLGMPPLAIAGLGIVAFCMVFLLIWLFFG